MDDYVEEVFESGNVHLSTKRFRKILDYKYSGSVFHIPKVPRNKSLDF